MRFAGSGNLNKSYPKEKNASGALKKEQKKLEEMILEAFRQGDTNLGNNEDILKQSIEVDRLIVNEMHKHNIEKGDDATDK